MVVSISKLGFSQFHQFSKLRPEPSGIPLHIRVLAVVLETTIPLSSWMILTPFRIRVGLSLIPV